MLNGVDLRIAPGQQVALVGLSGSGKSTMIQLLLRFYDASAGRITFNEHDITHVSLRWLRRMMGVVGQEPPLFSVSLRRNIAYADDTLSDEAVQAAAGLACATVRLQHRSCSFGSRCELTWQRAICFLQSFIEAMPERYDTLVGPKGVQLSGGASRCWRAGLRWSHDMCDSHPATAGQKQRVAIARAVIRNPPLLILDEVRSVVCALCS